MCDVLFLKYKLHLRPLLRPQTRACARMHAHAYARTHTSCRYLEVDRSRIKYKIGLYKRNECRRL